MAQHLRIGSIVRIGDVGQPEYEVTNITAEYIELDPVLAGEVIVRPWSVAGNINIITD